MLRYWGFLSIYLFGAKDKGLTAQKELENKHKTKLAPRQPKNNYLTINYDSCDYRIWKINTKTIFSLAILVYQYIVQTKRDFALLHCIHLNRKSEEDVCCMDINSIMFTVQSTAIRISSNLVNNHAAWPFVLASMQSTAVSSNLVYVIYTTVNSHLDYSHGLLITSSFLHRVEIANSQLFHSLISTKAVSNQQKYF